MGKIVEIKIDRPIGYIPKNENCNAAYLTNYGFIPNFVDEDGENLGVYLLGVNKPVSEYTARIIGIIHREDDGKDKLVVAPDGMVYNQAEIAENISFQERFQYLSMRSASTREPFANVQDFH